MRLSIGVKCAECPMKKNLWMLLAECSVSLIIRLYGQSEKNVCCVVEGGGDPSCFCFGQQVSIEGCHLRYSFHPPTPKNTLLRKSTTQKKSKPSGLLLNVTHLQKILALPQKSGSHRPESLQELLGRRRPTRRGCRKCTWPQDSSAADLLSIRE